MSVASGAPGVGGYQIGSINFEEDSVSIAYIYLPEDIRVRGRVVKQHQVTLHRSHPDYEEDADRLMALARKVLLNALDDFDSSPPWSPEDDAEDDDEDRGLGDG